MTDANKIKLYTSIFLNQLWKIGDNIDTGIKFLNASTVSADCAQTGKRFHWVIVLGQNICLYVSFDVEMNLKE